MEFQSTNGMCALTLAKDKFIIIIAELKEAGDRAQKADEFPKRTEPYLKHIQQADCQAAARRLLAKGPPEYVSDKHMLPVPEGDTHVCRLWFASDNKERSAALTGAVHGEAREALWAEHRMLLAALPEKEEGKAGGD